MGQSTRGHLLPDGKPSAKRIESDNALAQKYMDARAMCAKNPNGKNRRIVDALQKRLIRRQRRDLERNHAARLKSGKEKVRAAKLLSETAKSGADPAEIAKAAEATS
jgi:hypothetical protein